MNVGTVQGGTRAGWRIIRAPRKPFWLHECLNRVIVGTQSCYLRCPDCGMKRPHG